MLKRRPNAEHERRDSGKDTLDFHRSAPEAVPCLLSVERPRLQRYRAIHEMACGDGALVIPLRRAGFTVIATDIVDRNCPDSAVDDYLAEKRRQRVLGRVAAVTNPPFNRAEEFILRACADYDYVAMVLRLRYLGAKHLVSMGEGAIEEPLWRATRIPFARVIIPPKRFSMMHRDDFKGEKTESGMIDFAWFVWERGHVGSAHVIRAPDNACDLEAA